MDMSEQDAFNPADYEQVMRGARLFDSCTARGMGGGMIMLSGRELQQFAMWLWQKKGGAVPTEASGRRASDQATRERLLSNLEEIASLKAQVQLLEALRAGDRRKMNLPIDHPERRRVD